MLFHINHMKPATTRFHSRPVPSSSLAGYLTGVVGGSLLLAAPQAEASVTAITFGFGSVLDASDGSSYSISTTPSFGTMSAWATYDVDMMMGGPGVTTLRFGTETYQYSGRVYQQGAGNYSGYGIGLASFLADGTVIGNGGNGVLGMAYFASPQPARDVTTDQLNQNIGFQTSAGNWGWANVSWDATAKALTFNSAYVESVAGQSITVGDTGVSAAPEPSRALLALAGMAGVALRRRRKRVA